MPAGRPPSLTEEDLEKIVRAASLGLDDKQLAMVWGISDRTLDNYKTQYPEFFRSLKQAKLESDMSVVKSLRERATGYECKELKHFVIKNKVVEKESVKHYPPDSTSLIFWLKNRMPEQFRDKTEVDTNHRMPDISFTRDDGNSETS